MYETVYQGYWDPVLHLESTNWPKFLFVCVIFVLEIINKKFDTTVYQTASELDTPVAENLPQGKESYTPR